MNENRIYDVIVIGGGAAGCSAAISLARWGCRVVLFESQTYPHDKLCGEFLSPESANLLASLDMPGAIQAAGAVPIDQVLVSAANGRTWQADLPGVAAGISRSTLDALLAEQARRAGAVVCEGWQVTDVSGSLDNGFTVTVMGEGSEHHFLARSVIGAWGKRTRLDHEMRRQFIHQPQPFVALKAHFEGPPVPNRIELHGFNGGYCGISEIEHGMSNVCLLVREPVFRSIEQNGAKKNPTEGFIEWMKSQNERLGDWLSSARKVHPRWIAISQVPFTPKPPVENDILMSGDAAGLIAPLAGDGIAMAMESGILAANYLAPFVDGAISAGTARASYGRNWRRKFQSRIRLGRMLQSLMLQPAMLSTSLAVLAALPSLGHSLIQNLRSPLQ